MKSKLTIFITTLLLSIWSLSGNAQVSIPKGKAQLIDFTNATAKFTVPAGKTWYIMNIFSDCATNIKPNTQYPDENDYEEVRVFIKNIDNNLLTDFSKNKFGPVVYRGPNHERIQPMPIVLSENSIIEFIISSGDWGKIGAGGIKKNDVLNAFLNYIEVDN
jgi:hypothetical protein